MLQFVPWRTLALDWMKAGFLPLWNPLLGMGAPLWANYQTGILYPPNWLYFLTGPEWGQAIIVLLHLVLAAVGMVHLMRRFKVSLDAQITAALAFSLSGYLVSRAGFLSINAAAAWLPWLMYAIERLCSSLEEEDGNPNRATLLVTLIFTMQWLAGHAQTAWYSLILAGLWVLWRSLGYSRLQPAIGLWSRFCLAGLLAAGLAAPQLVPTLEYLANSTRASSLDPSLAMTYSFWPWRLLGLVSPGLYGTPVHGDYWGYGNYWEDAINIGVLPLLMVGIAFRRLRANKSQNGSTLTFLGFVSVAAFLLALGDNTPLFPFLFRSIPTFDLFQAPTRWTILMVFSLSVIAGLGFDAWKAPQGRGLYWTRLLTAGAGVIGLVAWLASTFVLETEPTFVRAFALAGMWFFLAGILALSREKLKPDVWRLAVFTVVIVDLVIAGWGLNPAVPTQVYETKMATVPGSESQHRIYFPADLEYSLTYERYFTFDSFASEEPWSDVIRQGIPNSNVFSGVPSVNNFDPIRPVRYELWLEGLENLPQHDQSIHLRTSGVARVANLTDQGEIIYDSLPDPQRAYLVPEAIAVSSVEEAAELVFSPSFDPRHQVVIEGEISPSQTAEAVTSSELSLIPTDNPNQVILEVATQSGGWLVLADTWYPGWQATIDGEETQIYPANVAFRAVWLLPGEYTITFAYSPASLTIGWGLFLITTIAIISTRKLWRN
jgi:hypothetical protein